MGHYFRVMLLFKVSIDYFILLIDVIILVLVIAGLKYAFHYIHRLIKGRKGE